MPPIFLLKVFFAIIKSKFVTLELQNLSKLWGSTEENGDFALLLGLQFFENLVPVGSSSIGAGFEAGNQVSFGLQRKERS